MRRWLLLFCIITHVVFAFAGTSAKHAVFSGRWTGHASDTLLFPIRENLDNQIREDIPASPLFLKLPMNIRDSIVYDPVHKRYVVMTLIGNKYYYKRPYTQTLQQLLDARTKMSVYEYNRQQIRDGGKYDFKNLVSEIQFLDKLLSPIFGKDRIKIGVQGSVDLTLGVKTNKVDNPTLPIDMRKTTTLDFDEKIQFNIDGKVGDLINLDWSYNTEATYDFENILKLNYEGKEDDIIKKVEAGNVSLPLPGTLISGAQNLWGFRTDLQFGKLSISSIFSQQKGEAKVIKLEKGAEKQEFEISALNYEVNRHFFLSKYFRDTYEDALKNLPSVNSSISIRKIEVWVTNKSSRFDQARNIVAFVDLGENQKNISNPVFHGNNGYPSNETNNLYTQMTTGPYEGIRDINQVSKLLSQFQSGRDYEKLENARLLDPSEYTLNEKLGYISLNTTLNADEVLAVAYEYTVRGEVYTVGELTSNALAAPSTLVVKMLKSTTQSPAMPTWDLMMKNIYNIGAYSLSSDGFIMDVLYQNDKAGTKVNYLPDGRMSGKILLSIMNLDRLNSQLDAIPDGRFDYIDGVTVSSSRGRVIFPVLEPFGAWLSGLGVSEQYIFQELYDKSQTEAEQVAEKNKYYLKGSYKSSSSSEISLGGGDIQQGSVKVLAGGVELIENIDYSVDYSKGILRIINQALLEAGTPITVKSEDRSLYGMQTRTLVGTHLDYKFNEKFNIGATIMHMNEKPLTHKVNLGEEPISNTIWGLNATYNSESEFITTLLNKLPFIHSKSKSHLTFDTEFAKFQPGIAKGAGGDAYLDDFESSKISLDMKGITQWKLASTPQDGMIPDGMLDSLPNGFHRARLAWYVVDPIFYRMSTATPAHIRADKEQRSNHFVREIRQTEIFPNKDLAVGDVNVIPALTVAYYPKERGPYNFNAGLDVVNADGTLKTPEDNWGGMMRSINTSDFEAANVQYIEMWLMDPFVYDSQHAGGDVYFDLGSVSEDILRDGRKAFENGLPTGPEQTNVDHCAWGKVPSVQSVTNGFDNNNQSRRFQDVGLDGLSDEEERVFYADYLENLRILYGADSKVYQDAWEDPAGDNYHFFRGSDFDAQETPVLERYKRYNGSEGNSPTADMSPESYPTAATNLPDVEDINGDNTLNETESFFRYHLRLAPHEMKVGENYITNITTALVELPNGNIDSIRWYQIKIPISRPSSTHNSPDLKSVRFMRMFLTGFKDSVILRMASLDLVRDNWRKYEDKIDDGQFIGGSDGFEVSVVSLEEDASRTPVNYVMPPGIERVVDATNPQLRELNEQAMALKVTDLKQDDARAVYKGFGKNFLRYKTLRMDVHAEAVEGMPLENDELALFIRLGNDNRSNYYEYEVPLKLTAPGYYSSDETGREAVWPRANQIELPLSWLQILKQKRNTEHRMANGEINYSEVYQQTVGELASEASIEKVNHLVKVKGKPTLADVKNIMIGVRNKVTGERSGEVWVNELRLSDFDNKGGWAANARVTLKLADVATVSFAGSRMTPGFGSLEQHASEIDRKDFRSIDFSTSVEFGKFFPQNWRLRIPMYYAYSRQATLPEYDPTDTDIPLDIALKTATNKQMRDSIKHNAEDYMMRKSLNFTNVGFESKDSKPHLFSLSNLTLTYSYNKSYVRNVNIERELEKNYRGLVSYIFNGMPPIVEPFKNLKSLNSKYLRAIKDFNFYYMPSMVSVTSDITRNYREILTRNLDNPDYLISPTYDKDFMWNRNYAFKFNLTRGLAVEFNATAQARIDEPEGIVDKQRNPERYQQWKDTVWNNILDGGRPVNYNHDFTIDYTVPINKLPFLDWTSARVAYSGRYDWQAAALTKDSTNLGNVIRNANSLQVNTSFSMTTLYNKSKFLRNTLRPPRRQKGKTVKFEKGIEHLQKNEPVVLKHRLKTGDIKARLTTKEGKNVKLSYENIGKNKIRINPSETLDGGKLLVTGTENPNSGPGNSMLRFFVGILTGIKNVSVGYSEDKGSTLPGFLPEARWLGQQSHNGRSAPGFKFLFGGQPKDFGMSAARKGWLTTDSLQNNPFLTNASRSIYVRAGLEPVRKLRIDLTSNWSRSKNSSEYIISDGVNFNSVNKVYTGNFSMSVVALKSSFYSVGNNTTASLAIYQEFLETRKEVARELAVKRYGEDVDKGSIPLRDAKGQLTGFYDGYGPVSQDVLVGAFMRTYANGNHTNLLPGIWAMRPNWKVAYTGLMDIDFMKKIFKSFSLNHLYTCKYNVGSFASNLKYAEDARDAESNFMALFDVNTVSINEQFNPLISMDMVWANNLTSRFDINRRRDVSLSLVNAQLSETSSNEMVIGLGYRFGNIPIFLKNKRLDNDVNVQVDYSIRKNNAVIRRISESVDQLTAGQKVVTLKVSVDYTFNNRLNLRLFYDRNVNTPYTSLSFPTTNTNFGLGVRYTLMQ